MFVPTVSRERLLVASIALISIGAAVILSSTASAAKRVECAGKRANVVGSPGVDIIDPGDLNNGDVVVTLEGQDKVTIDDVHNVTVCGGKASDDIEVLRGGGAEGIVIQGGPGSDTIGGSGATNDLMLSGQNGNDGLIGGHGDDRLRAGTGIDRPSGGPGKDVIDAGPGDDWVEGGGGADKLFGGPGSDNLFGEQYTKPPSKGKSDKGDGGPGRDYCQTARRQSCERKKPEIPF